MIVYSFLLWMNLDTEIWKDQVKLNRVVEDDVSRLRYPGMQFVILGKYLAK